VTCQTLRKLSRDGEEEEESGRTCTSLAPRLWIFDGSVGPKWQPSPSDSFPQSILDLACARHTSPAATGNWHHLNHHCRGNPNTTGPRGFPRIAMAKTQGPRWGREHVGDNVISELVEVKRHVGVVHLLTATPLVVVIIMDRTMAGPDPGSTRGAPP
jgi:hypothetical protein